MTEEKKSKKTFGNRNVRDAQTKVRNQARKRFRLENPEWKNSQLKMWPLPSVTKPISAVEFLSSANQ